MSITFEQIDQNLRRLAQLDPQNLQKVTRSMFEQASKELVQELTGANDPKWEKFKSVFVERQAALGFEWDEYRAPHNPLALVSLWLPGKLGEILAARLMQEGRDKGNLQSVILEVLPAAKDYQVPELGLEEFREGFKRYEKGTVRFAFGRNSLSFAIKQNPYRFARGNPGKNEATFGELILPLMRTGLRLPMLEHMQDLRKYKKYQNVDFAGYGVRDLITEKQIHVYAMELKPENSIQSVSDAISQAINYKKFSTHCYIVIPLFDYRTYFDQDRFMDFQRQCKDNEIGIISVGIDHHRNQPSGVEIVLEPSERPLEDSTLLKHLLEIGEKEVCPLCRALVGRGDERTGCEWSFGAGDGQFTCMKVAWEEVVRRNYVVPPTGSPIVSTVTS